MRLPPSLEHLMNRALLVSFVCALGLPQSGFAQEAVDQSHPSWGIMVGGVGVTGAYRGLLSSGTSIGADAFFLLASSRLANRADVMFHYIDIVPLCLPTT